MIGLVNGLSTTNPNKRQTFGLNKRQMGTLQAMCHRFVAPRRHRRQGGRPVFGLMAAITKSMKARTFAAGK
jgi:hypothetical protein